jgi:protein SCO1/2
MRKRIAIALLAIVAAGCRGEARQYEVRGQVIAVEPARQEILIRHDEVAGYMPAMTMPFKVRDARLLAGRAPGDLVRGTLVVTSTEGYLASLEKIGAAPIASEATPSAASGFELLKPGAIVPDTSFVDELGRPRTLASWKGKALVLTFIYTRCPFPTFCPLMDRNFAAIQREIGKDPGLRGRVHLLSVSFDPAFDTPAVLRTHAAQFGANPEVWSFVTGDRDAIDRFARPLGVSVEREGANITHNLRTAIVDPDGRLVTIYTGNEWTPDQVLADLRALHDERP